MADVHQTGDGALVTRDGWYTARCTCGFSMGQMPDLETVVDVLMEHAWDAGLRAPAPRRGSLDVQALGVALNEGLSLRPEGEYVPSQDAPAVARAYADAVKRREVATSSIGNHSDA